MAEEIFSIKLDPRSEEYLEALKTKLKPGELGRAILKYFGKASARVADQISRLLTSGEFGIRRRDGTLARSPTGQSEMRDGFPAFRVGVLRGPALRYAGIQEWGTQGKNPESPYRAIRPVRAKALAVPADDAKTPGGRLKEGFGGGPRSRHDLKFVPFKNSSAAIGALYTEKEIKRLQKLKRSNPKAGLREIRAAYLLLRQAELAPKHFIRKGVTRAMPAVVAGLAELIAQLFTREKGHGGEPITLDGGFDPGGLGPVTA